MKRWEEIRIIDQEEAVILLEALHPYFMQKIKEVKKIGIIQVKFIEQLYNELKYFVNQEHEE